MTLESLKTRGLISSEVQLAESAEMTLVFYSDLLTMKLNRVTHSMNVVIDDFEWVGVLGSDVISCKGERLYYWDKNSLKFTEQKIINDRLATIKEKKFSEQNKEEKIMADINMQGLNLSGLSGLQAPKPMATFGEEGVAPAAGGSSRHEVSKFMRRYGRFAVSITNDEPLIKVQKKMEPEMDGDDYVVDPTASKAEVEACREKNKGKITKKFAKKHPTIIFKESVPPFKGAILEIPEAIANVVSPLDEIRKGTFQLDQNLKATKAVVFGAEDAKSFIMSVFDGSIIEKGTDAEIKATATRVKDNSKTAVEGQKKTKVTLKPEGRKTLITRDNFIPLRLTEKAAVQNLTAEDAVKLNYSIEQAIKTKEVYDNLPADTQAIITWDDSVSDGCKVTSEYFKEGATKEIHVALFCNADEEVVDVMIPVKEKKISTNKEGKTTISYKMKNFKMEDKVAGPMSVQKYVDLVEGAGFDVDSFIREVSKKLIKKSSKPAKAKENAVSTDEFFDEMFSGAAAGDMSSASTINNALDNIVW